MDWIGKRVKIVMRDGFTKYGLVKEQDTNFIVIEYGNGRVGVEQIALSEVAAIKED